jgi:hypothetical protein
VKRSYVNMLLVKYCSFQLSYSGIGYIKQTFTNKDDSAGNLYLACSDLEHQIITALCLKCDISVYGAIIS